MRITCISASNTKSLGEKSASVKVGHTIKSIINQVKPDIEVDVLSLMNYELRPCHLCGKCGSNSICPFDEDFNKIYDVLSQSDRFFFIVPYYSPIPSKLMILFEKINEILYANWLNDPNYASPIQNKPVGIIGHGGMVENDQILDIYHERLITPISNTLRGFQLQVVPYNEQFKYGVPFGLTKEEDLYEVEGKIFPNIDHDWDFIQNRIKPLVLNVLNYN